KFTAYYFAIYGVLDVLVDTISQYKILDKLKQEIFYYRVFIRTHQDYLQNKKGRRYSIFPVKNATVDNKTGEKTNLYY
ncbi:secretion protein HlyD, partial [Salmonella enterica subsp. enterica serovar Weltevreden]|nr:secretion protein HlyD [Salmonella enterica subsp. enterica serovar Weltevreden]